MNESIREIESQIFKLRRRLDELRKANSAYFVLWEECGSSWDNYSRYYTPIGRITEDRAMMVVDIAKEDSHVLDAGYREVSEHEYQLFKEGAAISKILTAVRDLGFVIKAQKDSLLTAAKDLEERDRVIRRGLGLKYHWEHFLPEKWIPYGEEED